MNRLATTTATGRWETSPGIPRCSSRTRDVAVLGLGAGGLAAYARPGQRWEFVEINDAVARIARNPRFFTYLADAAGDVRIVPGDARQAMARGAPGELDAIVLDVFSSDAIPVHVITREALASYMRAVSAHGLVAWHLSNKHLDLIPVVAALAGEAGLSARVRIDTALSAAISPPDVYRRPGWSW